MKTEIDPKTTERAQSFEIWKNAPMPKVTLACGEIEPAKRIEAEHAHLLVHRSSSEKSQGVLHSAHGRALLEV